MRAYRIWDPSPEQGTLNRGTLNAQRTAILNTPAREQSWDLDQVGNWRGFAVADNGAPVLDQSRAHNKANEITAFAEPPGQTQWAQPQYDACGNMTVMPKPSSPASALTCIYDAWNRLAEVRDGGITAFAEPPGQTPWAKPAYDARGNMMGTREAPSEGSRTMRPNQLGAVLLAIVSIAFAPADASAFYHPGEGRFIQRDPERYVDGTNLSEYALSNPVRRTDPSGTIVIGLWGVDLWGDAISGKNPVVGMVQEIVQRLTNLGIPGGEGKSDTGTYFNRPNVENELKAWVRRIEGREDFFARGSPRMPKNRVYCVEPFIVFGFSDGATTIWRTIRSPNEANWQLALFDWKLGRWRNPAFIGLIDMARRWFVPVPGGAWGGEPPNHDPDNRETESEVNGMLKVQPSIAVNWRGIREADRWPSAWDPRTFRGFKIKGGKVQDRTKEGKDHTTILQAVRQEVVRCAVESAQVVLP